MSIAPKTVRYHASIETLRYWFPKANRKKLKRLQRIMRANGYRRTETPYGFLLRYNTRRVLKSTFDAMVKSLAEKIMQTHQTEGL